MLWSSDFDDWDEAGDHTSDRKGDENLEIWEDLGMESWGRFASSLEIQLTSIVFRS